jgi:MFS family permease
MSAGYIIWGISIISFAYIKSIMLTIVMDCVMTYFGSTANDAAYNAWLTDRGDSTNRGKIEGVNSMIPLVAILVVFGGFMSFDLNTHEAWTTIYYIIGIATTLIGVAGWFLIEDAPGLRKTEESLAETLAYSFRPSVAKKNSTLYVTLACFAVFNISIQIFMPYLIIYYEQTLGLDNYVLVFAPAIVIAAAATVFYGRLYDRIGFMKSMLPVCFILLAGYTILYFTRALAAGQAFIGSLLMMTGYLAGMSVFGAMIRDNIPEGRSGQFQGVRIIGQVFIPGLIGPAIGAWILRDADVIVNGDGTESFLPDKGIWSAAAVVIIVLLALLMLTSNKRKEISR